jgi:hypothetical protein
MEMEVRKVKEGEKKSSPGDQRRTGSDAVETLLAQVSGSVTNPAILIDFNEFGMGFIPFFNGNPAVSAVLVVIIAVGKFFVDMMIGEGFKTIVGASILSFSY